MKSAALERRRKVSDPATPKTPGGLVLGFPFDQLLNQSCRLWPILDEMKQRMRGIQLPARAEGKFWDDVEPGTGNIVICGIPGSGKTTLALQMAHACTRDENRAIAAYIALENRPSEVLLKAREFGWGRKFTPLRHMHCAKNFVSDESLSDLLLAVLTQPQGPDQACPVKNGNDVDETSEPCDAHARRRKDASMDAGILRPRVLVSSLSPRPLEESRDTDVFWNRYRQLERLLAAGRRLRSRLKKNPEGCCWAILPLVVLDSLNMMAMRPLTRAEMLALFGLFRTYETIGVFTVEATPDTPFDSTLADVVIRLSSGEDQGYYMRYLEIEKSRYCKQVHGKHPFKTMYYDKDNPGALTPPIPNKSTVPGKTVRDEPRRGVVVFPSLHYIVLRTREDADRTKTDGLSWGSQPGERWGIYKFDSVLPHNLVRGSVIVVEGPRGTFKDNLGLSFLIQGLTNHESGLLLHLHDQPMIDPDFIKDPGIDAPAISVDIQNFAWKTDLTAARDGEVNQAEWKRLMNPLKATINVWNYTGNTSKTGDGDYLIEIDFKTGALLAEEFIHVVRDVIIRATRFSRGKGITRVLLDDVCEISAGYPFLNRSMTSGDIFLPALAHIMRNEKIDTVVIGTLGDQRGFDANLDKIRAVADAVVSCRFCGVFGQRHVIVESEGAAGKSDYSAEKTAGTHPLVIRLETQTGEAVKKFVVDSELLDGLVGFDTGTVVRPGVTIHAFQENNDVHKRYNGEVAAMIEALFNSPGATRKGDTPEEARAFAGSGISLIPFDSDISEAVHDSLRVLAGKPLDRTVLYTVDEFWGASKTKEKLRAFSSLEDRKRDKEGKYIGHNPNEKSMRRYYSNVLLIAYRTDCGAEDVLKSGTWQSIEKAVKKVRLGKKGKGEITQEFWFDLSASETLSCALIDALIGDDHDMKGEIQVTTFCDKLNKAIDDRERIKNLASMQKVLCCADIKEENLKKPRVLPPDSAIYLCWYSQLRNLIVRHPELADKIQIRALPGGGFTGDWFIGVARGSVSTRLGASLLDALCNKEEEYKRFAEGIGLPNRKEYYDPLQSRPLEKTGQQKRVIPAWHRAKDVTLEDIGKIYRAANVRSNIENYSQFRSALSAVCKQLTPLAGLGRKAKLGNNEIKRTVEQLPDRIWMLGGTNETESPPPGVPSGRLTQ